MARSALRITGRSAVAALALTLVLGAAPREASADASGLCRAFSTILFAPTDIILGPAVAAHDMHYGMTSQGDPILLQTFAAPLAYAWLLSLQAGGAVLRAASGVYEIIPGFFTLFREGPSTPLNRSQDEAWALYSNDFGPCPLRIGSSYQTINEN
jgi:hypothetical protein